MTAPTDPAGARMRGEARGAGRPANDDEGYTVTRVYGDILVRYRITYAEWQEPRFAAPYTAHETVGGAATLFGAKRAIARHRKRRNRHDRIVHREPA